VGKDFITDVYKLILFSVSFVLCEEELQPDPDRVPEKIEHGEKGSSEYNVNTVTLTGNQHTKVDDDIIHPPWPPRPGRRSFITIKARSFIPTIWRPGRDVRDAISSKTKRKTSPQTPVILRPGRDKVPKAPPYLFRPGREDVPQGPTLFRPGRNSVPSKRDVRKGPPYLFRPGREDVPQGPTLFRPGRDNIPEPFQHSVVRPGRRDIRYNMPWTYVGSSVNAQVQQKSHTFHQKAEEEEDDKREVPQELDDEPQQYLQDF